MNYNKGDKKLTEQIKKPRRKRRTKAEIELAKAEEMKKQAEANQELADAIVPKTIHNTRVYNITVLFKSGTKITLDNYFEFAKDEELGLWKGHPSEISEYRVLEIKDECVAAVIFSESIATGGKRKRKR